MNVVARLQAECAPGGICVTRAVRDHVQDRLNLTFEELGALKLKNIARPVEAFVLRTDDAAKSKAARRSDVPPLSDRPSIAVLPFQNMSGDPEQEYFCDGIVEEIITGLSPRASRLTCDRSARNLECATSSKVVCASLEPAYTLSVSLFRP